MTAYEWIKRVSEAFRPESVSPTWMVHAWSVSESDCPAGWVRLTGHDTDGVISRGPRKGWPRFTTKNGQHVFVPLDKYRAIAESP